MPKNGPSSKKTFELFVLLRSLCLRKESSKVCLGSDGILVPRGVRAHVRKRT